MPAMANDLRRLISQLGKRLREETRLSNVSPAQVTVLRQLNLRVYVTVTALARAEGIRPQSMGVVVASLERAGLIMKSSHPSDRRQNVWVLTTAGHELIQYSRAIREDWLAQTIQTHLSPSEQDILARSLPLLKRLVEA